MPSISIDIVLQATGNHAWNMSEGWCNVLKGKGLLNRTFRPIAKWGALEPENDDGLFDYLKQPESDIIILLGFDWHSQPLHQSNLWQDRWKNSPIKKIAIINEMYSSDAVQQSQEWKNLAYSALKRSIDCVDAVICNHELDVEFLRHKEGIIKPITFQPFSIDPAYFNCEGKFQNRYPKAFFRGKIDRFYGANPYSTRQNIISKLKLCQEVALAKFQEDLLLKAYIADLKEYQILLNLPSISPTLTARTFEAIGCGGLLLQNRVAGEVSNQLFQDWKHLVYYDRDNSDDLIAKIRYLIKNPDVAEDIAKQGYELAHQTHTIGDRIYEILEWVENDFKGELSIPKALSVKSVNTIQSENIINLGSEVKKDLEREKSLFPKIVIDGVFFQISKSGIYRVWQSLLEEWSKTDFAKHLIILDRGGTAPRIEGISYRNIELMDYPSFDRAGYESQYLQFICDEVNASLFISTYYTTPISTPSVLMIHDMIPEVIKADLSEPAWREKQYAILHARKFITVSENTRRDLTHFYPHILPEQIVTAYNGVSPVFYEKSLLKVNYFQSKFQILQPYFLLVGGRYSLNGYKNAILFFEAWHEFADRKKIAIVCIGGGSKLEEELASLSKGSKVHMLSDLSDTDLKLAYEGAIALVYPSLYEGFGLPILEAMTCGCPVITCKNSSIPEVAGDAALYVDEYQFDRLLNALKEIQNPEVRQNLISLGLKQAEKFSWQRMSEQISQTLLETIKETQLAQIGSQDLIWQEFRKIQYKNQELDRLQRLSGRRIQDLECYVSTTEQNSIMADILLETNGLSMAEKIQKIEMNLQQKFQELMEAESNLAALKSSKFWQIQSFLVKFKTQVSPFLGFGLGLTILVITLFTPIFLQLEELIEHPINYQLISIGFIFLSLFLLIGIFGYFSLIKANILRFLRVTIFAIAIIIIWLGLMNWLPIS